MSAIGPLWRMLTFVVRPEEKRAIDRAVSRSGLTRSEWLRRAVRAAMEAA